MEYNISFERSRRTGRKRFFDGGDSYSKVETCDGIKFRLACRGLSWLELVGFLSPQSAHMCLGGKLTGHNDFLDFAYEALPLVTSESFCTTSAFSACKPWSVGEWLTYM